MKMMKKFLAFFLAMIMLLSFAGCGKTMCSVEGCENEAVEDTTYEESLCDKHLTGKKAFDASKIAYDSIDVAYEITEQYGSDVYEAWRMGIYDKDEILDDDVAYLASELSLSEEDIKLGRYNPLKDIYDKKEYSKEFIEGQLNICVGEAAKAYELFLNLNLIV